MVRWRYGIASNVFDFLRTANKNMQIWDLFEGGRLFRAVKDGHLNDEQHLAEMVSLLGPPPKEFLEKSDKSRQYWDPEGKCMICASYENHVDQDKVTG